MKAAKSLKREWGMERAEMKGRNLHERQFVELFGVLRAEDVVIDFRAIDMGRHDAAELVGYQAAQAETLLEHIAPSHHPSLVQEIRELQETLSRLPVQLFVQAVLTIELVNSLLRSLVLFLAFREARELGTFDWTVDAKANRLTDSERVWRTLVSPFLQSMSLKDPLIQVEGGDYRAFARFCGTMDQAPAHLAPHQLATDGPFEFVDVKTILNERFRFAESSQNLGIQLADAAANCARRAFGGRLRRDGWRGLGPLLLRLPNNDSRVVALRQEPQGKGEPLRETYTEVVRELTRLSRDVLPE